jgi:hypothetical protein
MLRPHLRISSPPITLQELDAVLANDEQVMFESLLTTFLQGTGIPIPEHFASAKDHFNSVVDLDAIEESGFRARMLCWAATGSCERAADTARISVS